MAILGILSIPVRVLAALDEVTAGADAQQRGCSLQSSVNRYAGASGERRREVVDREG